MAPQRAPAAAHATKLLQSAKKMALRTAEKLVSKAHGQVQRTFFNKWDRHRLYHRANATAFQSLIFGREVSGASYGNGRQFTLKTAPALAKEGALSPRGDGAPADMDPPRSPLPVVVATPAFEEAIALIAAGGSAGKIDWQEIAEA